MTALMKEYDWAKSPVRVPQSWSPALRARTGPNYARCKNCRSLLYLDKAFSKTELN
jgi:hypothetical protein